MPDPLGQLAMKEAAAAGYELCRLDRESGVLVRLQTCGLRVGELEVSAAVSFPARVAGLETHVLTFVFLSQRISEHALTVLNQMADVFEAVLGLSELPARCTRLALRAAELETQLMCAKIRDRARGLIQSPMQGGFGTETLARFSGTLLHSAETPTMLERLAREREQEIEERSLASQAKAVLESVHGMSEEQAHHHLRVTSRRSRRPLTEVALEYIGKRS
jgi:hypothetical protein